MKQLFIAFVLMVSTFGVAAADEHPLASGEMIKEMIGGNTVQGSMADGTGYTEFYAEDGVIKGDGYTGAWRVDDNQMCFKYGDDPENCWSVGIKGDQVSWIKDGNTDGTGTIVPGNPNNF
ncbi:MAG: hypothetical protein RIM72_22180 [Alphaproteobacteria bacterium]